MVKVVIENIKFQVSALHQLCVDPLEITPSDTTKTDIPWDTADKYIITTYPYFLAHPYKRALEEEDGFKSLHLLKEVFLNYLKYFWCLPNYQ